MEKTQSRLPFYIVWLGQLASNIGSGLSAFALGVYVFHLTGSAAYYSLVILAALLPSVILKPIGGVIADRYNRRLLMMIGDAGAILGVLFIIIMMSIGVSALWPIYVGSIISSLFVALHNPAYKASITDLLDEDFYSKGSGLVQLAESSRYLIAPMVAGMLLLFFNIIEVLIIDCATFGIAVLSVFWVRRSVITKPGGNNREKFLVELLTGFRYLHQKKGLFTLLKVTTAITFFVGVLQALWGPLILSFANAQSLGISQSISSSGMLISSLLIGLFSSNKSKIPILSISLCGCGLSLALMGISSSIYIITLFGFLFFLSLPFCNTSLDVLVRRNIETQLQGRAWAFISLISQTGMLVALASSGFLADHLFNPLLLKSGILSSSIGHVMGVGSGRGIGLMLVLAGLCICIIGITISRMPSLKVLDKNKA